MSLWCTTDISYLDHWLLIIIVFLLRSRPHFLPINSTVPTKRLLLYCKASCSDDDLIPFSRTTADTHCSSTHIADGDTGAPVLTARLADGRRSLFVVCRCCRVTLTTKVPLSYGAGQRSRLPSARWDKRRVWLSVSPGADCQKPLSVSRILLHHRPQWGMWFTTLLN